jgi:hypothetical protein
MHDCVWGEEEEEEEEEEWLVRCWRGIDELFLNDDEGRYPWI